MSFISIFQLFLPKHIKITINNNSVELEDNFFCNIDTLGNKWSSTSFIYTQLHGSTTPTTPKPLAKVKTSQEHPSLRQKILNS